jgi:ribonuclease D
MKEYAATDTAYLPPLRDRLNEELEARGRREWAQEEFERRETTRWTESADELQAFLKVKGARDLNPRGLAVLRELFQWREEVGRERDQATFRVLGNQSLIELSLRAPTNRRDLVDVKGVAEGLADRRGRDILEAIRRGLDIPDTELPRFPATRRWDRDPEAEARAEQLRRARNEAADRLDLDPGFLMSRATLDEIARRNPTEVAALREIPDVRRWQIEALGQDLIDALRG